MDAYDRHVVVKQIPAAKAERDVFLHQHRNFPTRRCSSCHETWELLPKRFPKYKLASGREHHRKTCRFCLRAAARAKERKKMALDRMPIRMLDRDLTARRSVETGGDCGLAAE
jgi:hypothetical protein